MNLDDFQDITSAPLVLKSPVTGDPTDAVIQLSGPENPVRKQIHMDRVRKARAELRATGNVTLTDPADDYDTDTDYFVTCTLGWSGLQSGGTELPYSADAARKLYTDPKTQWVRKQVAAALAEAQRFIKDSAKA